MKEKREQFEKELRATLSMANPEFLEAAIKLVMLTYDHIAEETDQEAQAKLIEAVNIAAGMEEDSLDF